MFASSAVLVLTAYRKRTVATTKVILACMHHFYGRHFWKYCKKKNPLSSLWQGVCFETPILIKFWFAEMWLVKHIKQNIENPNNGKRNANLDKVLIYRTAIRQVANDVKKSRIKCRKQQSIRTLSYQYDTIVFLVCQEFFQNFCNCNSPWHTDIKSKAICFSWVECKHL